MLAVHQRWPKTHPFRGGGCGSCAAVFRSIIGSRSEKKSTAAAIYGRVSKPRARGMAGHAGSIAAGHDAFPGCPRDPPRRHSAGGLATDAARIPSRWSTSSGHAAAALEAPSERQARRSSSANSTCGAQFRAGSFNEPFIHDPYRVAGQLVNTIPFIRLAFFYHSGPWYSSAPALV